MSILQGPGERDELHRLRANEIYVPRKDTREDVQTIGHGALACPSCDVPIAASEPIRIGSVLRCPFCRKLHGARSYLRLHHSDTPLNDVRVIVRLVR